MDFITLVYALFGWLVGVLINHVADRLPRRAPLGGAPTCVYCGTPRSWVAWSAVTGYLSGRRVCLGCGAPLSLRSVVVELATPVIFVGLLWRYGATTQLGLLATYSAILILVTVTDLEHRLIQHAVMAPALLVAMAGGFFNAEMSARRAFLGGAAGLLVLYGMYLLAQPVSRILARLARRTVEDVPFGFGDVTLGAFIGLITGLPGVFVALIIAILSAGAVAALLILIRAAILRRYDALTTMPYGPFLALGGFVVMVYGSDILRWYISR
jgi:leader peptidase (prepilin peptidase)/N-methyltransferase